MSCIIRRVEKKKHSAILQEAIHKGRSDAQTDDKYSHLHFLWSQRTEDNIHYVLFPLPQLLQLI